jgi:hypothetical protein
VKKLTSAQLAALNGKHPPNATAEQIGHAFRDSLKLAGLGATVRKNEHKP